MYTKKLKLITKESNNIGQIKKLSKELLDTITPQRINKFQPLISNSHQQL